MDVKGKRSLAALDGYLCMVFHAIFWKNISLLRMFTFGIGMMIFRINRNLLEIELWSPLIPIKILDDALGD